MESFLYDRNLRHERVNKMKKKFFMKLGFHRRVYIVVETNYYNPSVTKG